MTATKTETETFSVRGDDLVARAKALVHEGNVRRIIVKNESGQTILEVPLTLGVFGAVMLPVWVALGAVAALAKHYTLEVERHDEEAPVPIQ